MVARMTTHVAIMMIVLGALLALTSGCSSQINEARDASNIAQGYLAAQKEAIEDVFREEVRKCIVASTQGADLDACVSRAEHDLQPLVVAYEALRAARNALEVVLGAAQAGSEGALAKIPELVAAMMSSIMSLQGAIDGLSS